VNRFGQKDILRGGLSMPRTQNLDAFMLNDPVTLVDPSGLHPKNFTVAREAAEDGSGSTVKTTPKPTVQATPKPTAAPTPKVTLNPTVAVYAKICCDSKASDGCYPEVR
jgi:hypothetical protein